MESSHNFGINGLALVESREAESYRFRVLLTSLFALFAVGLVCNAHSDDQPVLRGAPSSSEGCTIGVASGVVTVDGRPIMWKLRDWHGRQQLVYDPGSSYGYVGIRSEGEGYPAAGLNGAGLATGNSAVGSGANFPAMDYVLKNYASLDEITEHWRSLVDAGECDASGCFPFLDAQGNAVMFEIGLSNWLGEYDSLDPDRETQGLYGFVVRANEFHQRSDGTDNQSVSGRYASGTYNVLGLLGANDLSVQSLIQGNEGPNQGYEFVRYGPGRQLASIVQSTNVSTMVVHGVAPDEDPALATMWVILGQANYGITVPVWAMVTDIPRAYATGEMYDRAASLVSKKDETTTQASVFPVEAHMFDVVTNKLLPHWRSFGVPSVTEMTRIEQQMANDAFSLLDCLDNRQDDNMAATVVLTATIDAHTLYCTVDTQDSDGHIIQTIWDFGDEAYAVDEAPVHAYAEPGTYLVSCTVTDDDGVSITDWAYCLVP